MYEVKRYDGQGNLIEVVSAEVCRGKFWAQFGEGLTIPKLDIENHANTQGMFHLVPKVENILPEKPCAHCGRMFQPPKNKKNAKFCFKPELGEMQQCRRLAYREKTLKPKREVICAVCEKPFMTPKSNAKYCPDPECNRNSLTVRQNAGGRFITCHYCGFRFKASHTGNQKYCIMPYFVRKLQCVTLATEERKRDKLS